MSVDGSRTLLDLFPGAMGEGDAMPPLQDRNVLVAVSGAGAARDAVAALQQAGFDGRSVSMVVLDATDDDPPTGDAGDAVPEGRHHRADVDQVTGMEARAAATGGLIAAIVGALAFVVVGQLAGVTGLAPAIALAVGGGLLAGAIGGLFGAFTRLGAGPAWTSSLGAGSGAAVVAAHCLTPDEVDRAQNVLSAHGKRTYVADADGALVDDH